MSYEVRKLPKKTIFIISIIVVICFVGFIVLKTLKELRMEEILKTLGHENISQMQVINKLSVEDTVTRYKSTVYKVKFHDNKLNQTCVGFIHFQRDNKFSKDVDCK